MSVSKGAVGDHAPGAVSGSHAGNRLQFVDNLRWVMIVLVLSMHAADTYSPLGNWYFVDRRPIGLPTLSFFAGWQMFLQSFFMGLLFFIAGCFVPPSLDRKGPRRFLRDRLVRLGLPVLLYMLVIGPVTEYYAAHSWNSTEPTSFGHEWIKHIANGQVWQENGPLWFCLALLVFSAAYVGVSVRFPTRFGRGAGVRPFPRAAHVTAFAALMAAATFAVRLSNPPTVFNLPLRDFAQYALLFGAGIVAARGNWLTQLRAQPSIAPLATTIVAGLAALFALLYAGGFARGNGAFYYRGAHWQCAAFALWESSVCVAMGVVLLRLFRGRFDRQGRRARFLSDNAFAVYAIHPPVLIMSARLIQPLQWPSAALFATLWALAGIGSFASSALVFRRLPLLKQIL